MKEDDLQEVMRMFGESMANKIDRTIADSLVDNSDENVTDEYLKRELGIGLKKVLKMLKETNPELFV